MFFEFGSAAGAAQNSHGAPLRYARACSARKDRQQNDGIESHRFVSRFNTDSCGNCGLDWRVYVDRACLSLYGNN